MNEISSKEYANIVEDAIVNDVEITLANILFGLSQRYHFKPDLEAFHNGYQEGIAAEVRDLAIQLFEEVGLNVRSDGRSF